MRSTQPNTQILFVFVLGIMLSSAVVFSQVGINTTAPANGSILDVSSADKGVFIPKIDIVDLSTIAPVTGVGTTVAELQAASGLMAFNTNTSTGPGFFFWAGDRWQPLGGDTVADPPIDSVTLAADTQISNTTWANFPGLSTLTFTARKTDVLVQFTASGFAFTNSMALVEFRIRNITATNIIGGTTTHMQSYDDVSGSITPWSASFSKLLTGLTIGSTYTLRVQCRVSGILGTSDALIWPSTFPDTDHLTLSVIQ